MAKVVLTHNVADVDKWLSFKAERASSISQMMGGSNVEDLVAADGSNAVAVSCDLEDVEAALAAIGSPPAELQAQFEKHGVLPPFGAYVAG